MKIMSQLMALCFFIMSASTVHSQILTSKRQNYFNKYAEKLPAPETELAKAFTTPEGGKVKISFADFTFNGMVTSSVKRYDNLYSVIIKSPGLDNTLLSISKRIGNDGTISYVGHIINENYADGFELRKEKNGSYAMNKIKTDALIEDY